MAASPPLHSAQQSTETKQHLEPFSHFAQLTAVSLGIPGHVLSAKNNALSHGRICTRCHGSFSLPESTALWYNCAGMAYHYSIPPCLHSYTITLYWLHGYRLQSNFDMRHYGRILQTVLRQDGQCPLP